MDSIRSEGWNMKGTQFIGLYQEFVDLFDHDLASSCPAMRDYISDDPIDSKEVIIDFLLNAGTVDLATSANAVDVFTGDPIPIRDNTRTDGVYSWGEDLAYYVDQYNLRLPEEFVQHILAASK